MAKESKKGFVLYYDYRQHLALLSDEERGRLLMALFDYEEYGKETDLEGAALMAFSFIKAQIDRDAAKYAATCRKRSEAGKQGGRPPKTSEESAEKGEANAFSEKQTEAKKANAFSEKQTEAKKADTETDTETDTDTDTETDTDTDTVYIPEPPEAPPAEPPAPEPPAPEPPADHTPYKAIVAMYHDICKDFPKLRSVNDNRKAAIAARWKEYGHDLDTFRELFELAEASSFLKGKNSRNWAADFNWLMNSANMAKVLEGNYNNDRQGGQEHERYNVYNGRNESRGSSGNETALPGSRSGSAATLSGFQMADG